MERALRAVPGVVRVSVSLEEGSATVLGAARVEDLVAAVNKTGKIATPWAGADDTRPSEVTEGPTPRSSVGNQGYVKMRDSRQPLPKPGVGHGDARSVGREGLGPAGGRDRVQVKEDKSCKVCSVM